MQQNAFSAHVPCYNITMWINTLKYVKNAYKYDIFIYYLKYPSFKQILKIIDTQRWHLVAFSDE